MRFSIMLRCVALLGVIGLDSVSVAARDPVPSQPGFVYPTAYGVDCAPPAAPPKAAAKPAPQDDPPKSWLDKMVRPCTRVGNRVTC